LTGAIAPAQSRYGAADAPLDSRYDRWAGMPLPRDEISILIGNKTATKSRDQALRFDASKRRTSEHRSHMRSSTRVIGRAARIFATNAARGTQDVNDPEQPSGCVAGPYTGSFTSWVPFLR